MISVVNLFVKSISLILSGLFLTGCFFLGQPAQEVQELKGPVFGAHYIIKFRGELDQPKFKRELEIFFQNFNQEFSTYQQDSVVSQLNRAAAGERLKVSPRFIQMLEFAKDLHQKTEGAFDPTLGPVIRAWGFGGGKLGAIPDDKIIQAGLKLVGMRHFQWDKGEVWKTLEGVQLDLNAFAPGWAADLMGEMLEANGITDYMVDISGELRIRGTKFENAPWVIGIEKPAQQYGAAVQLALKIENTSIATSGDYRQFFDEEGERRSHIIDPRTGRPVTHRISSATVIGGNTMEADAWSTALMVLGERGVELAEKNGFKVYLLEAIEQGHYRAIISSSMQDYIKRMEISP
jgi:FAD:protein FMN transferase